MKKDTIRITEKNICDYLEVEEVPQELLDYVGVYELQGMNFGERDQVIGGATKQTISDKGKVKSSIDNTVYRVTVMKICIRNCPLKSSPTLKYVQDMPVWMGEAIWGKILPLNASLGGDEAKKFSFS